jgi:hypothetical protein
VIGHRKQLLDCLINRHWLAGVGIQTLEFALADALHQLTGLQGSCIGY